MKTLKKFVVTGMIAASLAAIPVRQANAGIILLPCGVGIVLIILGALADDALMILLDGNGNLSQDSLESALSKKYAFLDDRDVVRNLATAIREKAASTVEVDGKKSVSLSREEVLAVLEPTGLAELNPAAVEQIVTDLQ